MGAEPNFLFHVNSRILPDDPLVSMTLIFPQPVEVVGNLGFSRRVQVVAVDTTCMLDDLYFRLLAMTKLLLVKKHCV
jgi:hypothetical protein